MIVVRSIHSQVIRWILVAKYCYGVDHIDDTDFRKIKYQALRYMGERNVSGAISSIFNRVEALSRKSNPAASWWDIRVKPPSRELEPT